MKIRKTCHPGKPRLNPYQSEKSCSAPCSDDYMLQGILPQNEVDRMGNHCTLHILHSRAAQRNNSARHMRDASQGSSHHHIQGRLSRPWCKTEDKDRSRFRSIQSGFASLSVSSCISPDLVYQGPRPQCPHHLSTHYYRAPTSTFRVHRAQNALHSNHSRPSA